jgi:hypothetical protein
VIVADLDTLKMMLGVTATRDDAVLQQSLDAAVDFVGERCYRTSIPLDRVQQATLLLASRLYKRRLSPEGVAGWNDVGVVRIVATDPDIARLLEHDLDMTKAGIA